MERGDGIFPEPKESLLIENVSILEGRVDICVNRDGFIEAVGEGAGRNLAFLFRRQLGRKAALILAFALAYPGVVTSSEWIA